MKLGVSLYSFGADLQLGRITLDEALEYCAELGAEGVEIIGEQHLHNWPHTDPAELLHIRSRCEALGLEIFCFSTYLGALGRPDRRATREEYLDMVRSGAAASRFLGAKVWRPAFNAEPVETLIDLVRDAMPILEQYQVVWGVELHVPFPPSHYMEALQTIDSPYFRLIPDFSCWQTGGLPGAFQANPVETIEPLMPYIVHCHGKGHVFDEAGEEINTPYKAILDKLKAAGYQGSVVCEYEGWHREYHPSREMVKTHFALICRYGK